MLNTIVVNFLINKAILYNTEAQKSIIINDVENLDSVTERIKTNGITKIFIGDNIQELPLFEGLQLINSLEIRSKQIQSIPIEAFSNNQNIQEVILSSSITRISEKAFYNSSISKINLDHIREIKSNSFCLCKNLIQIKIPNIQMLSSSCFKGTSLVEVNLPSHLTIIPGYSFCNCIKLQSCVCDCIYIDHYAFCNCTSMKFFNFIFRNLYGIADTAFLNASI